MEFIGRRYNRYTENARKTTRMVLFSPRACRIQSTVVVGGSREVWIIRGKVEIALQGSKKIIWVLTGLEEEAIETRMLTISEC